MGPGGGGSGLGGVCAVLVRVRVKVVDKGGRRKWRKHVVLDTMKTVVRIQKKIAMVVYDMSIWLNLCGKGVMFKR